MKAHIQISSADSTRSLASSAERELAVFEGVAQSVEHGKGTVPDLHAAVRFRPPSVTTVRRGGTRLDLSEGLALGVGHLCGARAYPQNYSCRFESGHRRQFSGRSSVVRDPEDAGSIPAAPTTFRHGRLTEDPGRTPSREMRVRVAPMAIT